MQVFIWTSVFNSCINAKAPLLDFVVRLALVLQETAKPCSKYLYHVAFPKALSDFSIPSLALGGVGVLDFGHSCRCAVVSHFLLALTVKNFNIIYF